MMQLHSFWYRKRTKTVCCLLQAFLAGVIALCVIGLGRLTDGDLTLGELGRSFENTGSFFRTVEQIIRDKIACDQNQELFERGGTYDGDRYLDIRQYLSGALDETSANFNLSYRLDDLISFAESGAPRMEKRMAELAQAGYDEVEIGNALLEESASLETVLPASGVSLADFARMNANPAAAVQEYYRDLVQVSQEVARRYTQYSFSEANESSSEAPSNVAYYVENTAVRQYYSNFGATSLLGGEEMIYEMGDMLFVFEGERRFNIMVSHPDRVLSDRASDYFMQVSFLGSGEQVLIAVDPEYRVGDELQLAYRTYQKRIPFLIAAFAVMAAAGLLLIALLVISVRTAGRGEMAGGFSLGLIERLPTEISAGLCLIAAIIWWMAGQRLLRRYRMYPALRTFGPAVAVGAEYGILLFALLSLLRRWRSGNFWENSVFYYVVLGTRQVYSARKSSQRLVILYLGFVVFNMIFLVIGGPAGGVMALVLNLAALLYLMRDVVGNQNVREGLYQISKGRLDYRINTNVLTGESREMGQAVNEMGDGLEKAVEAMLQGERLKAELITNVSHDLKTPLTSIISYVDLLRRREISDETAKGYIQVLDQKTQRLKQLTEDLIEASKISSGNIELHPEQLQLRQMLRQACGEFEDRFEERDLTLALEIGKEPVTIRADGAGLWRVFENLLSNIVKYAKRGSEVRISLSCREEAAWIRFENESAAPITVSADTLLERFGRGDASRSTEGSGLGLSIAGSLTQLMGGTFGIQVEETRFEALLSFPLSEIKN